MPDQTNRKPAPARLPGRPPRDDSATYQTISIRLSPREREMLFALRAVAGSPTAPAEISHLVREWLTAAFDSLPAEIKSQVGPGSGLA